MYPTRYSLFLIYLSYVLTKFNVIHKKFTKKYYKPGTRLGRDGTKYICPDWDLGRGWNRTGQPGIGNQIYNTRPDCHPYWSLSSSRAVFDYCEIIMDKMKAICPSNKDERPAGFLIMQPDFLIFCLACAFGSSYNFSSVPASSQLKYHIFIIHKM